MANTRVDLTITRGSSGDISGTITPVTGEFSLPVTHLRFLAKDPVSGKTISKTLGAGVATTSEAVDAIAYSVTLDPADTKKFDNRSLDLLWDLVLIETGGHESVPVGGHIFLTPRAG